MLAQTQSTRFSYQFHLLWHHHNWWNGLVHFYLTVGVPRRGGWLNTLSLIVVVWLSLVASNVGCLVAFEALLKQLLSAVLLVLFLNSCVIKFLHHFLDQIRDVLLCD